MINAFEKRAFDLYGAGEMNQDIAINTKIQEGGQKVVNIKEKERAKNLPIMLGGWGRGEIKNIS